MELVDILVLGTSAERRAGSNPAEGNHLAASGEVFCGSLSPEKKFNNPLHTRFPCKLDTLYPPLFILGAPPTCIKGCCGSPLFWGHHSIPSGGEPQHPLMQGKSKRMQPPPPLGGKK
jgi:hypothetical protein